MLIYKIFRRPEWDAFRAAGRDPGAPVDLADGYIHFSTAARWPKPRPSISPPKAIWCWWPVDADALGAGAEMGAVARRGAVPASLPRAAAGRVVWDKSLPLGATGHIFPEGVF